MMIYSTFNKTRIIIQDVGIQKNILTIVITRVICIADAFTFVAHKYKHLLRQFRFRVLIPLPELDENGQRIFLLRLGAVDPNKVSMDEVFKLNFMAADLIILEDHAAIIGGNVILLDLQGVNMAHVIQLSPVFVKKTMAVLQVSFVKHCWK